MVADLFFNKRGIHALLTTCTTFFIISTIQCSHARKRLPKLRGLRQKIAHIKNQQIAWDNFMTDFLRKKSNKDDMSRYRECLRVRKLEPQIRLSKAQKAAWKDFTADFRKKESNTDYVPRHRELQQARLKKIVHKFITIRKAPPGQKKRRFRKKNYSISRLHSLPPIIIRSLSHPPRKPHLPHTSFPLYLITKAHRRHNIPKISRGTNIIYLPQLNYSSKTWQNRTIVTHDKHIALQANRIINLHDGKIVKN